MKEHEDQQLRTSSPLDVNNDNNHNSTSCNNTTTNKTTTTATSNDQLERCGKWLLSIPRDDVIILQREKSTEYQDFILAFERLGLAHRLVICRDEEDENDDKYKKVPRPATAKDGNNIMGSSSSSSRTSTTSPTLSSSSLTSSLSSPTTQQRSPSIMSTTTTQSMSSKNNSSDSFSCYDSNNAVDNSNSEQTDNIIPCMVSATTTTTTTTTATTHQPQAQYNFWNYLLQHTGDDVILKIFEFLDCTNLQNIALTCTRFKRLAYESATQRTTTIVQTRQLTSVMQLLRAQEQIHYGDYISTSGGNDTRESIVGASNSNVRVPMLLLGRRLIVSNAGDPEYNGTYYCTTCNGNGYVFTKPRYPIQRLSSTTSPSTTFVQQQDHEQQFLNIPRAGIGRVDMMMNNINIDNNNNNNHFHHNMNNQFNQQHHHPAAAAAAAAAAAIMQPQTTNGSSTTRFDRETIQPGQPLRCIISKRFSNDVSTNLSCMYFLLVTFFGMPRPFSYKFFLSLS
jgi:hypothetical protein